jgi:hypothetical protein
LTFVWLERVDEAVSAALEAGNPKKAQAQTPSARDAMSAS